MWGSEGLGTESHPSGVLVGGADNGGLFIWDPTALMAGSGDGLIDKLEKHSGPVAALDFNPFQV